MNRSWIVAAVVIVVAYVVWRKFGDQIKGTISSVTA